MQTMRTHKNIGRRNYPGEVADLTARGLVVPHYVMESPPENMRLKLEYLYENYQGAGKYL